MSQKGTRSMSPGFRVLVFYLTCCIKCFCRHRSGCPAIVLVYRGVNERAADCIKRRPTFRCNQHVPRSPDRRNRTASSAEHSEAVRGKAASGKLCSEGGRSPDTQTTTLFHPPRNGELLRCARMSHRASYTRLLKLSGCFLQRRLEMTGLVPRSCSSLRSSALP
jgi:hypothetical protein